METDFHMKVSTINHKMCSSPVPLPTKCTIMLRKDYNSNPTEHLVTVFSWNLHEIFWCTDFVSFSCSYTITFYKAISFEHEKCLTHSPACTYLDHLSFYSIEHTWSQVSNKQILFYFRSTPLTFNSSAPISYFKCV